ncbi:MAG: cupin domain-containing protein [Alphaproteobacteria bacterium]
MGKFEGPVLIGAGEGGSVNVLGAAATYKATHAQTAGQYSLFEQDIPVGYGAPMHRHDTEDEAFYVLEGEIVLESETGTWRAGRGSFAYFPRGSLHGFRNESGLPARALVICTPGAKLERCFKAFEAAGRRGDLVPAALGVIAASHGVEIVPPA